MTMAREHLPGRTDDYLETRFYLMTLFESQYQPGVDEDSLTEYMARRLNDYDAIGVK